MTNSNLIEEDNKLIVKQSLSWHLISLLLETIHNFHEAMAEPEFSQLLSNLENYVEKVITLPDYDIKDAYVAVELEK